MEAKHPRIGRRSGLALVALVLSLMLSVSACAQVGATHRPVILIVIDTLRADHLGLYGYSRPTSPSLDQWSKQAAVFNEAFSTSPWTLPSFATMFTGQLPSRHLAGMVVSAGAEHSLPARAITHKMIRKTYTGVDPGLPTLAEVLRDHGYATGAVINNAFLGRAFGMARGFQSYDFSPLNYKWLRRANVVVGRALSYVDAHATEPFFLVVHFMDPHMSYDPPASVQGRFTRAFKSRFSLPVGKLAQIRALAPRLPQVDRDFITAAYDEELAFVDAQIGRFFRELDKRGLGRKVLVFVTADHGEELFDHGGFEHGHTMYDELLRVPLLVRGPGVRPGRRQTAVSLVDLMPTILEAAGVPVPADLFGVSLWPALTRAAPIPPRRLFAECTLYGDPRGAMIRWPLKLVVDRATGQQQLFDLATDPGEHTDEAMEEAAEVEIMRQRMRVTVTAARRDADAPVAASISDATREELRALGYLGQNEHSSQDGKR